MGVTILPPGFSRLPGRFRWQRRDSSWSWGEWWLSLSAGATRNGSPHFTIHGRKRRRPDRLLQVQSESRSIKDLLLDKAFPLGGPDLIPTQQGTGNNVSFDHSKILSQKNTRSEERRVGKG